MNLIKGLILALVAVLHAGGVETKPLKVFILAGQSNMEGHAHIRTLPAIAKDPKTADLYKDMVDSADNPVICDHVRIAYSYGGPGREPAGTKAGKLSAGWGAAANPEKIGPEYTFGIYMHKMLGEPILIIKTAWGGRNLYNDFRPPSAGENTVIPADKMTNSKHQVTSLNYKLMIDYVKTVLSDPKSVYENYDATAGYELSGFVWFQGFNDMVGPYPEVTSETKKKGDKTQQDYAEYSRLLSCLIRDVRKDLSAPTLPFVIGVMGIGGKDGNLAFRKAMAAPADMAEFKDTVVNVFTEKYWPAELDPVQDKIRAIKENEKRMKKKAEKENPDVDEEAPAEGDRKKDREKEKDEIDAKIDAALNDDEMWLYKNGISNAPYHYHGSAKFFGQVGKAFAEALVNLKRVKN